MAPYKHCHRRIERSHRLLCERKLYMLMRCLEVQCNTNDLRIVFHPPSCHLHVCRPFYSCSIGQSGAELAPRQAHGGPGDASQNAHLAWCAPRRANTCGGVPIICVESISASYVM
jgi:hypothetical protein